MLIKDFIEGRLRKRKLPQKTSEYARDVSYITPDYVCDEPESPVRPQAEEKKHGFTDVIRARVEDCKKKLPNHKNEKKQTTEKKNKKYTIGRSIMTARYLF